MIRMRKMREDGTKYSLHSYRNNSVSEYVRMCKNVGKDDGKLMENDIRIAHSVS